jgi:DNA-binding transcriptional MerR regulator
MEWTIGELATAAATAVAAADVRAPSRRVTDLPDERTIRWYATIGLLDRPSGSRGRTALYGERHLLQLVAIKRRQAQGRTLAEIQAELVGASERTLRRIAALPGETEAVHDGSSRREFWREAPAAPAAPQPAPLLSGVDLGGGVVLMLPGRPTPSDIERIQAAAGPLLDLLAERRLTRGSAP